VSRRKHGLRGRISIGTIWRENNTNHHNKWKRERGEYHDKLNGIRNFRFVFNIIRLVNTFSPKISKNKKQLEKLFFR